jgi:hypothetical protein
MKITMQALLAASAVTSIALVALPIAANDKPTRTFVEMAKANTDGKIEKSRVMGMMDKGFDQFDSRKEGKLDARQARQFELFLREFTRESGG